MPRPLVKPAPATVEAPTETAASAGTTALEIPGLPNEASKPGTLPVPPQPPKIPVTLHLKMFPCWN